MLAQKRRALALAAALTTLTALPAAAEAEAYANPHLIITADALAERVGADHLVVLDVRPSNAYRAGHIPGAQRVEPDGVADPDAPVGGALRPLDELAAMAGQLGISADSEVVLYDDKGGFHAARIFWLLEYMGHRNVKVLNGGIQAWTAAGQDLETGRGVQPEPARFRPAVTPRRFASADWIMERREDPDTLVIDVRPTGLYDQGHIPWAVNVPWKGNLNDDKTMKSPADLRAHFQRQGITPDRNIVVHCQNGLASAHSYFALRLLGYPQLRTYHRSWAEWGSADDLPKAVAGG